MNADASRRFATRRSEVRLSVALGNGRQGAAQTNDTWPRELTMANCFKMKFRKYGQNSKIPPKLQGGSLPSGKSLTVHLKEKLNILLDPV